ncbi:MAG: hypothetical protein HY051_03790 [Candidatus Aenigmarchaeota archaeon]|nr:hypothetical protein [Candidatus Aenigmarchaeota archaeon]
MKPKNTMIFIAGLILLLVFVNMGGHLQAKDSDKSLYITDSSYATMLIPAVDETGEGIVTNLTVQVKLGSGRSLVDINNLFFWVDTQNSIRTAKDVAQKFTGADLKNYDIIYSIVANASAVEGPSAGAAIAIATIAALENKNLKRDAMITGTINPDGSIGKVGDVMAKAAAAKSFNATLFLIPAGQSEQTTNGYEKACKNYLVARTCSSVWMSRSVDVGKEAGIEIVEVSGVKDAMRYLVVE